MTNDTLKLEPATIKWLETRGISAAVAAKHGVVTVNGKHTAFEFRDSAGELLYRKARVEGPDGSKRFMRDRKGAPAAFFNLANQSGYTPWEVTLVQRGESPATPECGPYPEQDPKFYTLIICEGEVDALSWIQAGFMNVLSVPDGAQRQEPGEGDIDPLQDTGFAWMWGENGKLISEISPFKHTKVVIATDDDSAGAILREELAIRLGPNRCWYIPKYPEHCKDANDVLVNYHDGEEELVALFDSAKPIQDNRIVSLMDMDIGPERPTWQTSWKLLDKHLKITSPELMIITGEPGAGKSQFAFHLGLEMARLHRHNFLYLQFEDHPKRLKDDALNYADQWSRQKGNREFGTGDDPEAWIRARVHMVKPPEIGEDAPDQTLAWVQEQIEMAVYQKGCKLVIIDPWNEVEHAWGSHENETQYTNKALKQLKSWSRKLNICLIIVAHPGKAMQGKTIDECSLYDVSGSAAWNNKADHGIILKRLQLDDAPQSMVEVKVSKSKDWQTMGVPGQCVLEFCPRTRLYVKP